MKKYIIYYLYTCVYNYIIFTGINERIDFCYSAFKFSINDVELFSLNYFRWFPTFLLGFKSTPYSLQDSGRPEDKNRRFIIFYRLSDDMMVIYEPPVRNSGIIGGKFLERTRVCKPGITPEQPQYYGPQDFYIGSVIEVFKHRFVITDADEYVLKYMKEHSNQFPG